MTEEKTPREASDRRDFVKRAAQVSLGLTLGGATIGLGGAVVPYLRPDRPFLPDWKGVFPLLGEDGHLVFEGPRMVRRDVDEKAPPGGQAGFLFLWRDTYWKEVSPAIIVRDGDGGYRAASIKCTHEKCAPHWDDARRVWACPCHRAVFEAETGRVLEGPPPAPLPLFRVTFEGEQEVVRLIRVGEGGGAP